MIGFINDFLIISNFKKKIKKVFGNEIYDGKKQILLEFNAFANFHISGAYLANYLKKKYKCNIFAFFNYYILSSGLKFNFINKIKWNLGNFLSIKNFGIYKSIGVDKIFRLKVEAEHYQLANIKYKLIKKKIKNKKDVLSIKIEGVLIGDLIYDTYLKKFYEPTLIFDDRFYKVLKDFLILFYYWKIYFQKNVVKAVITGHFVYSYGLIIRIALKKNIQCYHVTLHRIYKATKKNSTFSNDAKTLMLKKIIKKTNKKILFTGKKLSKNILKKRVYGGALVGADLPYVSKSSFKNANKEKKFIVKSKRKKILICTHDFFDAVHLNRNNLFVDFKEWLEFLGKLSEKTNYDWYIKTHPYYDKKFEYNQSISYKTLKKIIDKYKQIEILPNNYNHKRIVNEGIDLILTVYGSVAMEYALMNKKVITACKNNIYSDFDFNIHAKSIKDYENKILNSEKIKLKIKQSEIFECYFARHLHHDVDWIIPNYGEFIRKLGYSNQFTTKMYSMWKPYLKKEHTQRIFSTIDQFHLSTDNMLNIYHSKNYKKFLKYSESKKVNFF